MSKMTLEEGNLLLKCPDLVEEWNWKENKGLRPENFVVGSHKHVWWKCSKCGHEWPAEIRMRAKQGQGCPECGKKRMGNTFRRNLLASGKPSLRDEHPELAEEWDYTKNGSLKPEEFTSGSSADVNWRCKKCGYEWPATINNRVKNKSGCPLCSGSIIVSGKNDLFTKNQALASEWHPKKNLPLTPHTIGAASNIKVWWICKYGHEYPCRISDRVLKNVGCTECSKRFHRSKRELIIAYYLKDHFQIQNGYRPAFLKNKEIDIFLPQINTGIEYDGQRYHTDPMKDLVKDQLCQENGIKLIRIREPKCPKLNRSDPSIELTDLSDNEMARAINDLFRILSIVTDQEANITEDKSQIMEFLFGEATSKNILEKYPEIAAEWDPILNGELQPQNIPATQSKEQYFWKCQKCGYSWPSSLSDRINGTGCPACAGKVIVPGQNDLATTNPELAKEWHPTKNEGLTPQDVSKGSDNRVWWKCSVCGHEWPTRIKKRVYEGSGCVKCKDRKRAQSQYKKVLQISKDDKVIKIFESARIAATELGISRVAIQHACTGRLKTAGGYYWKYDENE